jgi:hypothetical protein
MFQISHFRLRSGSVKDAGTAGGRVLGYFESCNRRVVLARMLCGVHNSEGYD